MTLAEQQRHNTTPEIVSFSRFKRDTFSLSRKQTIYRVVLLLLLLSSLMQLIAL